VYKVLLVEEVLKDFFGNGKTVNSFEVLDGIGEGDTLVAAQVVFYGNNPVVELIFDDNITTTSIETKSVVVRTLKHYDYE